MDNSVLYPPQTNVVQFTDLGMVESLIGLGLKSVLGAWNRLRLTTAISRCGARR